MARSRIAEMVEEEAARAEAEDDTAEPGEPSPGDDPEDGDDAERADTIALSEEALMEAFEAEQRRHEQALAGLFGDDWESMGECSMCSGIGHVPSLSLQAHPETVQCSKCAGHGVLATGSQHDSYMVIPCEACTGQGYTRKLIPVEQPAAAPTGYIYLDPATGQPVQPQPVQPPLPANGQWAPGYAPVAQPLPPGAPQA